MTCGIITKNGDFYRRSYFVFSPDLQMSDYYLLIPVKKM